MQRFTHYIIALIAALVICGCKPGIPRQYLQPDVMADILYDYHIAEGIQSVQPDEDSVSMRAYQAYILKKYKVSRADFDSSLVYYTRHTVLLEDVYKQITERLNNESAIYGGAQLSYGDDIVNNSDTASIWQGAPSMILLPYAAFNNKTFEIQADTSYHAGDKILLDFDTKFIYQDGIRDAVVVLAVTYSNDSVEVVNNSLMSSSHYHLQINNMGRMKIKNIRGFWLHNNTANDALTSKTTLKMLLISNIQLIRMHTKAVEVKPISKELVESKADSVKDNGKEGTDAKKAMTPLQQITSKMPIRKNE